MNMNHILAPCNPAVAGATTPRLYLPPVSLFRPADSRPRRWIMKSTFDPRPSCLRRGDFYLSLKLKLSSINVERERKPALRSSIALASSFWTNRNKEDEGPSKLGLIKLRKQRSPRTRAYKDFPYRIPYPEVIEKPAWWWRTLACIPYLMALQLSDIGFYFQPLMESHEQFQFLSYYVPGAIRRLPSWFFMAYCYAVYAGVVRKREWPHFLRYHAMMGLLLENVVQIVWHASNFMPLINYHGTFGMHYWAMVGFISIAILLGCLRCAVAGLYVHIPFISDAAYLHTPYTKGDS